MTHPDPVVHNDPVWTHLLILALVACFGLVVAVATGWAQIPWREVTGLCIWFAGLCVVCAISLRTRF